MWFLSSVIIKSTNWKPPYFYKRYFSVCLQGLSVETIKAVESGLEGYQAIQKGNGLSEEIKEKILPMLHEMALDIGKQHKRLGGKWAIAQAVFNRSQRDQIKKDLGPDLNFIVLNLTRECQLKRVCIGIFEEFFKDFYFTNIKYDLSFGAKHN